MNLLNLDVDAVFEQHNISEVDAISRKIQSEIELKKEELRTMVSPISAMSMKFSINLNSFQFSQVGERYRDLLQAADTIAEMKATSANLSTNILSLQSKEQSSDFKSNSDKQIQHKKTTNNPIFSTAVQIKILTTLPELIWSRIDDDDFFDATQLFIFSRHISTGLKLDAELMTKFPVAKKQWELLAPFFFTIKQQCLQTLERENLTSETASKCLASLLLLENCQLEKLLSTFLQTRSKTFQSTLCGDDYDLVKEKLLKSIKILISTVKIINECFIGSEKNEGLLALELKKISGENSRPTISLIENQRSSIYQTLPDIIAKYKPQVFCNELSQDAMKTSMSSWMKNVEKIAHNQLKSLIKLIGSIKTIQDIQQQMRQDIEKPENWPKICQSLYLPEDLDFFKQFYQSLINERIQDIINIFWEDILRELHDDVKVLVTENEDSHLDLQRYVWMDDIADNPLSLKDALSTNKSSHRLLMKVKGYSTSIVKLCIKIDKSLEKLFKDLENYLKNLSDGSELKRLKSVDPNHQKIVAYLKECSKENISKLITTIKSSNFVKTAENSLTLARLLQAISELCPNLQACFSGHLLLEPSYLRDPTKNDDSENEWKSIQGLLKEESLQFWTKWMNLFIENWSNLDPKINVGVILKDFPSWETITIDEKDESENIVQSQIHVPSQISLSVHCWIYEIIDGLNKIIPHTLPKIIHLTIVNQFVEKFYKHYETLSKDEFVAGNQKSAWQFFFDLKILTLLFVSRDNKEMNEKLQILSSHFKSIIDPFDFDVFYPHVSLNIKKNAARLQFGVACLVPNMEHLNNILTNQNVTSSHDKDPNILMMSSTSTNVAWFPLLPVITTKETVAAIEIVKKDEKKQQGKSSSGVVKKQPMQTSSSNSTLSSLQDWFR